MLSLGLQRPLPVAGVTVRPHPRHGPRSYQIQTSVDKIVWTTVASVKDSADAPVTTKFAATRAYHVRLSITDAWDTATPVRNVQVAEFEIIV